MRRSAFVTTVVVAAIAAPAATASTGRQVWNQAGCAGCHTLAAAGASGNGGPNLDQLRPSQAAVAAQVASGGGGMPSFAGSLTSAQIQTVAAWVSSVAGGGGGPVGGSGMTAAAVRRLQHELHALGYFNGPFTGYYGSLTTAAVRSFQKANRLTSDGVWGPKSAAALKRRLRR